VCVSWLGARRAVADVVHRAGGGHRDRASTRRYADVARRGGRWCARRDARKALFKLVDGPLSYYFCNDEHAIRWCDYRHSSVAVNKLLNTPPSEREATLRGVDVDVWVAAQLNLNEL